jgi:hypothetical protein
MPVAVRELIGRGGICGGDEIRPAAARLIGVTEELRFHSRIRGERDFARFRTTILHS